MEDKGVKYLITESKYPVFYFYVCSRFPYVG
jgi:hypothetical protein